MRRLRVFNGGSADSERGSGGGFSFARLMRRHDAESSAGTTENMVRWDYSADLRLWKWIGLYVLGLWFFMPPEGASAVDLVNKVFGFEKPAPAVRLVPEILPVEQPKVILGSTIEPVEEPKVKLLPPVFDGGWRPVRPRVKLLPPIPLNEQPRQTLIYVETVTV